MAELEERGMEVRSIKFPPATLNWLRQRAFALSTPDTRMSVAQVVRDAVEEARRRDEQHRELV